MSSEDVKRLKRVYSRSALTATLSVNRSKTSLPTKSYGGSSGRSRRRSDAPRS